MRKLALQDFRLYFVTDPLLHKGYSVLEQVELALRGGVKIIQIREKDLPVTDFIKLASEALKLTRAHDAFLIINDSVEVVKAVGADGLHLGQDDLPVKVARKLLPIDKLIGCSAATVEQAVAAESDGADYVAVASIYPTSSKEMAEVVGLDRLRQIKKAVSLPLVAIGGINKDNAQEVMAAGAVSIAVISAILQANNIQEAARQILNRIEK